MHHMTRSPEAARVRAPFDGASSTSRTTRARLSAAGRRAVRALSSPRGGEPPLSRHAGHRRPLPRGLRRRRGGDESADAPRRRAAGARRRRRAAPAGLVRVRDGELPAQGLLGDGGRAAGAARGRRLERDLHLLPQHDALLRQHVGRAARARGAVATRARWSIGCCRRDRRWRFEVGDGRRGGAASAARRRASWPRSAAAPARRGGAGDRRAALAHGIGELRAHFAARHFVEVGIGCEACHGGSREHVDDPARPARTSRRAARSWRRARRRGRRGDARRADQPHLRALPPGAVLALPVHLGGRAAARRQPGGSSITSGEARDFLLGGCARQMACIDLPRSARARIDRGELDGWPPSAGNGVCVALPRAVRGAGGAGGARAPRSGAARARAASLPHAAEEHGARLRAHPLPPHRLARRSGARRARSPARVRALPRRQDGRPSWSATMERWWGKRYDRARAAPLYGDLDARPLVATLARGKPHEQAVALAVLGEARVDGGGSRRWRASW